MEETLIPAIEVEEEEEVTDRDQEPEAKVAHEPDYDLEGGCWGSYCCRPGTLGHKMIALTLISLLGFSSYFCYDCPGALQSQIVSATKMSTLQFTILYSLYSVPNMVLPIVGGYLIDGVMGRISATIMFTAVICIGQFLFAGGVFLDTYDLMALGRFVFGLAGECVVVAQNTYTMAWFRQDELNTVFAVPLAFGRAGSSASFVALGWIYNEMRDLLGEGGDTATLGATLFLCGLTCVLSFLCSIVLGWQDKRRQRLGRRNKQRKSSPVSLRGLLSFPSCFWLFCLACTAYYNAVYLFVSLGQVFLINKYDLTSEAANYYMCSVYLASIILAPLSGKVIDKVGRNLSFFLVAIVLTAVSHALFAASFVNVWVPILLLGVGSSVLASTLWPIVASTVPENLMGTASGLMTACQNVGLATQALVSGTVVDAHGYMWMEVLFLLDLTLALFFAVLVWILDGGKGGCLNMSVEQRKKAQNRKKEAAAAEENAEVDADRQ